MHILLLLTNPYKGRRVPPDGELGTRNHALQTRALLLLFLFGIAWYSQVLRGAQWLSTLSVLSGMGVSESKE